MKFLRIFLAGILLLSFPTAVSAAQADTFESEKEQGTLHPSSAGQEKHQDSRTSFPDEEPSPVDWGAANAAASPASGRDTFTVVIDPGHQGSHIDMSAQEPVAPGSQNTKAKATSGTAGNFSGVPEYELNLQISLLLQQELLERGYQVVMTRCDNDTAISNKERAELAAEAGADITLRIHANSDSSSSVSGALTMAPTSSNPYLSADLIEKSNLLASCVLRHYCSSTELENRGILSADQMTGTNWSTVPVAILEMGFMSNQNDDLYLTDSRNHPSMVTGIADGIDEYFSTLEPASTAQGTHLSSLTEVLQSNWISPLEASGQRWAVAVMDPATSDYSTIHGDQSMESAGLIKTFLMGTVFESLVFNLSPETPSAHYEDQLKPLLTKMITENDTASSDQLVLLLGNGDFAKGAEAVNRFCQEHGFTSTKMGNELFAENSTSSNFTSASDCCRILTEIFRGTLVSKQASEEMLEILKQQKLNSKLPAGLPSEIQTAHMTGYMEESQNPILIENDMAIVLHPEHPYVICVLAGYFRENAAAVETIKGISAEVYQAMTQNRTTSD